MAYVLLHTSSQLLPIQNQAIRLQRELQIMGHEVELSFKTHPLRLLKNNYDIFHILTDTPQIKLKDIPLVLIAQYCGMASVISEYHSFRVSIVRLIDRLQSVAIDAYSTAHVESLKANRILAQNKFVLPLFPTPLKLQAQNKLKKISQMKVLSESFSELNLEVVPDFVDASRLTLHNPLSVLRKKWNKFKNKNPIYRKTVLILNSENTLDLLQAQLMILDLTQVTSVIHFQSLTDQACALGQFIILNQNQASGYSEFWIHSENCWIFEMASLSQNKINPLMTAAQLFFKKSKSPAMKISIENKMNELSRLYSKIMRKKSLVYAQNKVKSA